MLEMISSNLVIGSRVEIFLMRLARARNSKEEVAVIHGPPYGTVSIPSQPPSLASVERSNRVELQFSFPDYCIAAIPAAMQCKYTQKWPTIHSAALQFSHVNSPQTIPFLFPFPYSYPYPPITMHLPTFFAVPRDLFYFFFSNSANFSSNV